MAGGKWRWYGPAASACPAATRLSRRLRRGLGLPMTTRIREGTAPARRPGSLGRSGHVKRLNHVAGFRVRRTRVRSRRPRRRRGEGTMRDYLPATRRLLVAADREYGRRPAARHASALVVNAPPGGSLYRTGQWSAGHPAVAVSTGVALLGMLAAATKFAYPGDHDRHRLRRLRDHPAPPARDGRRCPRTITTTASRTASPPPPAWSAAQR